MVKEAEENAESDKKRKEEADLRNECDQLMFSAKKSIEDLGEQVTQEEKDGVDAASKKLEEALKGSDLEAIKTAKSELEKAAQSIAVKAYEKIQKEQQAAQGQDNSTNDDGSINAEYENID